jgi:hypothetical protein
VTISEWRVRFTPESYTVDLPPSAIGKDFVGTGTYRIRGRVTEDGVGGIPDVRIDAGEGISTTTNSDGTYELKDLFEGTYTVVPSKRGYTFTPPQREVEAGALNVNFEGHKFLFSITGHVTDDAGDAVPDVRVEAISGDSATSDDEGLYALNYLVTGTYTVTASKLGHTLMPLQRVLDLPPDATDQDFTAYPGRVLHIRAYIDGVSYLILSGDSVRWYHRAYAAPGRLEGADEPTYLNGWPWFPAWPDEGGPENRGCDCDSSSFSGVPPVPERAFAASLNVIQARDSVRIAQQPGPTNDHTIHVRFSDSPGGAAWYEVQVIYTTRQSFLPLLMK